MKKEKNHLCIKGVRWLTNKGTIICFSTPISVHVDNTFAENQIEMKETNKIKTEHNTVYYLTYGSQMLRVDDNFSYSLVFIWTEKKIVSNSGKIFGLGKPDPHRIVSEF